jgi:hypothetical protein
LRQKKTKYPPDMKLRKVEALAYLNCGSTTFTNYIKAGKIKHVDTSSSDPRTRFYLVADLDGVKSQLGSRTGIRLKQGPTTAIIDAIANELPDAPASSHEQGVNTPLSELDTTQARLMEAVGIPGSVSLHKGQQLLRQHVLVKAIQSKAVNVLFAGLDNPDARIQQQAVKNIFSLILPQLKTVESIKIENPEDTARAEALRSDIHKLHERIKQLKLTPPTITMEGVRVIDVD